MSNPSVIRSYTCDAAVAAFTIVKGGTVDANVTNTTAATDASIGVSLDISAALGERVDVAHSGIAFVTAGAAFSRGARLTSDASGRAIVAAPAAGSNVSLVGIALEAASALGDVVNILVVPSVTQG